MSKAKFIYVYALYGGIRGAEASIVGSVIFATFYIIGPAIILGFANELTQYMFSRTIMIIVPSVVFLGVLGSIIPGVVGGVLLSVLLYLDIQKKEKVDFIVSVKGYVAGTLAGFLLLFFLWQLNPLNPPLAIEQNLFIFYSITGVLSASIGGRWAVARIFKDGIRLMKDVGR